MPQLASVYGLPVNDPDLPLYIYGDVYFRGSARYLVEKMQMVSAQGWLYDFDYVFQSMRSQVRGAGHGDEVFYLFGAIPESTFNPGPLVASALKIENKAYPIVESVGLQFVQCKVTGSNLPRQAILMDPVYLNGPTIQ